MTKRIAALAFIFACTSIAWIILGSTIFARTYSLEPGLKSRVASSWGTAQQQSPPSANYLHEYLREVPDDYRHTTKQEKVTEAIPLSLDSSKVDVKLDLDHRQKGLLWYSTYSVQFAGVYDLFNPLYVV